MDRSVTKVGGSVTNVTSKYLIVDSKLSEKLNPFTGKFEVVYE